MPLFKASLDALMQRIDYQFADIELLRQALTHASAVDMGKLNNERMEFLGDRVLGLVIADMLFETFPSDNEGLLARRLNAMVRLETCADVAREIGIPDVVMTAPNEARRKLNQNKSVLGDACEALIAALYLDGGMEAASSFIRRYWKERVAVAEAAGPDAKTALQEWAALHCKETPEYAEISRSGPDHDPDFVMEVRVCGLAPERAQGKSKRMASHLAAEQLLRREGVWS